MSKTETLKKALRSPTEKWARRFISDHQDALGAVISAAQTCVVEAGSPSSLDLLRGALDRFEDAPPTPPAAWRQLHVASCPLCQWESQANSAGRAQELYELHFNERHRGY